MTKFDATRSGSYFLFRRSKILYENGIRYSNVSLSIHGESCERRSSRMRQKGSALLVYIIM